jgi:hypothetical protein
MPLGYRLIAKTNNLRRADLFDRRLYAYRSPDLNPTHGITSRGLEIAKKIEGDGQNPIGFTQSLADVADQKVIREDAESLLASVRYNSGHILKILLQSREFPSVSSCRRQ